MTSPTTNRPGTKRWPPNCEAKGEFILIPRVLIKRFGELQISPQELLLILMLQVDRYADRKPRFYWEQLAEWCGLSKHAVRKWGYSLKKKKLLNIKLRVKREPGEKRVIGKRHDRSEFDLTPFLDLLEKRQQDWLALRAERKGHKNGGEP